MAQLKYCGKFLIKFIPKMIIVVCSGALFRKKKNRKIYVLHFISVTVDTYQHFLYYEKKNHFKFNIGFMLKVKMVSSYGLDLSLIFFFV